MATAGVTVHYLFALLGQIPQERPGVQEMIRFAVDHTLFLNAAFLVVGGILLWLHFRGGRDEAAAAEPEQQASR